MTRRTPWYTSIQVLENHTAKDPMDPLKSSPRGLDSVHVNLTIHTLVDAMIERLVLLADTFDPLCSSANKSSSLTEASVHVIGISFERFTTNWAAM